MNAGFRVRASCWGANEEVDQERASERDRLYFQEFLASKRARTDPTLWKYFAADAFHDGAISGFQLDPTLRRLKFSVDCPNVRCYEGDDFSYVNVGYDVTIGETDRLTIRRHDENLSRNTEYPYFGFCEIETCEQEIEDAERRMADEHHSLIIEADLFTLAVVFGHVSVAPTEPAATRLMLNDPRYKFPFAEWREQLP